MASVHDPLGGRSAGRGQARLRARRLQRAADARRAASPTTRASARRCRPSSTWSSAGRASSWPRTWGGPRARRRACRCEPVAARLAELLGPVKEVRLTDEAVGDGARKVVTDLRDGEVALLENLRFDPARRRTTSSFAKALAGLRRRLRQRRLRHRPPRPRLDGGHDQVRARAQRRRLSDARGDRVPRQAAATTSSGPTWPWSAAPRSRTRLPCSRTWPSVADAFLIGGAMANTFLKAQGGGVGKSKVEDGQADRGAQLPQALRDEQGRDPAAQRSGRGRRASTARAARWSAATSVPADRMALDIGPQTVSSFADCASPPRARCSGTGRWACSRRRRSPPGRWPSPARWPPAGR